MRIKPFDIGVVVAASLFGAAVPSCGELLNSGIPNYISGPTISAPEDSIQRSLSICDVPGADLYWCANAISGVNGTYGSRTLE